MYIYIRKCTLIICICLYTLHSIMQLLQCMQQTSTCIPNLKRICHLWFSRILPSSLFHEIFHWLLWKNLNQDNKPKVFAPPITSWILARISTCFPNIATLEYLMVSKKQWVWSGDSDFGISNYVRFHLKMPRLEPGLTRLYWYDLHDLPALAYPSNKNLEHRQITHHEFNFLFHQPTLARTNMHQNKTQHNTWSPLGWLPGSPTYCGSVWKPIIMPLALDPCRNCSSRNPGIYGGLFRHVFGSFEFFSNTNKHLYIQRCETIPFFMGGIPSDDFMFSQSVDPLVWGEHKRILQYQSCSQNRSSMSPKDRCKHPLSKNNFSFSMPFIHILIMSDLCLTILCWGTYVPVCPLSWSLRKQTTSFAYLLPGCDDRSSFWWNSKTPSWGRSPKFLSARKHQTFRKVVGIVGITKTWPAKPWMSRNFIVLLVGMVNFQGILARKRPPKWMNFHVFWCLLASKAWTKQFKTQRNKNNLLITFNHWTKHASSKSTLNIWKSRHLSDNNQHRHKGFDKNQWMDLLWWCCQIIDTNLMIF